MGFSPSAFLANRQTAVGASPLYGWALVHPLHAIHPSFGGGSEPPPYEWALVHPLHVMHPSFGGGSEPPPYEITLIAPVSTPRAVFDR